VQKDVGDGQRIGLVPGEASASHYDAELASISGSSARIGGKNEYAGVPNPRSDQRLARSGEERTALTVYIALSISAERIPSLTECVKC